VIRLCVTDALNWRNFANGADYGLSTSNNSSDQVNLSSPGGFVLTGATPNMRFGGTTASFPMLKRNSAALNVRLADDSADAVITASVFNASTGFQIAGAAPAAHVPRGNGTNYVDAQLSCSDLSNAGTGCSGGAGTAFTWNCYYSANLAPGNPIFCNWTPRRALTIRQMTLALGTTSSGCSTGATVAVYDSTAASTVTSLTTSNGTQFYDSGNSLNLATTSGHQLNIEVTTPSAGCGQNPANAMVVVQYD